MPAFSASERSTSCIGYIPPHSTRLSLCRFLVVFTWIRWIRSISESLITSVGSVCCQISWEGSYISPCAFDGIIAYMIFLAASTAERLLNVLVKAEDRQPRSEEHTSELQSLMRISYAVFCLKKKI